jgi:hypothetical protein
MSKILSAAILLIISISLHAQPQVFVHDPPIAINPTDWGVDLQVTNSVPEGSYSGVKRGPGDTLYLAVPDTNIIANRCLLILRSTNNGANWSVVISVQPAAVVEKTRMVRSGLDSIYCVMRFGAPYDHQIYILRVTGTTLLTQMNTGGYRDFDCWASSTGSLYIFVDNVANNSIPRYATTNGGITWSQNATVCSSCSNPFVAKSGQGDTSILAYYQIVTGVTDTTTSAITTAKYRETAPGTLGSGNFNTGIIPPGTQKDQFENASYGGIVWMMYTEGAPGSRDIKYFLSTNSGNNFTGPNTLVNSAIDEYYFDIKNFATGNGGVDVVYLKDSTGATNDKIMYTNAGTLIPTTFATPLPISENTPTASPKMLTPELIEYYNPAGDVAAIWTAANGIYFDRLLAIVGLKNNNEIADEYSLGQNYPNPFNPKTIIKFSIPKNENVTLKLYDMLGREVMILINKEMTAGSYSVEIDATALSSGVYLYKIISGSYTDTKKMILMK